MSIQVANKDLSGAVIGTKGAIPLGQIPPLPLQSQMAPKQALAATLMIYNESGCGLTCTFPVSQEVFTVPAGGWKQITVPPNETELDYLVVYVLPNAPVTLLLADLYLPGEALDHIGILGNSPIGLSQGTVQTSITQVIQDGQPAGQTLVEATPTGGIQKVLMDTNGNFYMAGVLTFGVMVSGGDAELAYVDTPTFAVILRPPFAGANPKGGVLQCWDGSNQFNPFSWGGQFGAAPTYIKKDGSVGGLAGQATAGSFGVPVIVASVLDQHITVTTNQTIISTTLTPGIYRVNGVIACNNLTSPQALNVTMQYTDKVGAQILRMPVMGGIAGLVQLNGTNRTVPDVFNMIGMSFEIASGTFTLTYQDPGGTPNDFVSVMIERLA